MAGQNSTKLCECGCGQRTSFATEVNKKWGHIPGQPMRFVAGHRANVHRYTRTKTYYAWAAMKYRCNRPKSKGFGNYGGRGISVCSRWGDFRNFLADMGMAPKDASLDRIDNDGNYEPGNCRWASPTVQCNNTRRNVYVTHEGRTQTVMQWSKELGLSFHCIYQRLERGVIPPVLFWPSNRGQRLPKNPA